mmetsp:Transcript_21329/g.36661  ORF Transcript_21329/g.36661 Transcript_21329/m.36661 type:complete len:527 (-) Transcript_21329:244-1824(-)
METIQRPENQKFESTHIMGRREPSAHIEVCPFVGECLSIVVLGASGDLAKKKTYPSLFALWNTGFLPKDVLIMGYSRSKLTDDDLRQRITPGLSGKGSPVDIQAFLRLCVYRSGPFESEESWGKVEEEILSREQKFQGNANRLFYMAVPPSVFSPATVVISKLCMGKRGWNRFILEKPFGHDLASFEELSKSIDGLLKEEQIYRIDHYLGKEMVANLSCLRFANSIFEPLWNRNFIKTVTITFKEDIGTQGRGGYFDSVGIVRDVMQNHLLQVLSIVAMEAPIRLSGENFDEFVRNEKVKVLQCIDPIHVEECVLGQFTKSADGKNPGYQDDDTVPKGSKCPTFATIVLWIRNPRWEGVPFVIKAGKGLNERKAEIRIQFHAPPAAQYLYPTANSDITRNELVLRMQPEEAVYMKTNVKKPGLTDEIITSELDLSYKDRFPDDFAALPDAYTRLILEVLRGNQAAFVRDDELRAAWKIFSPFLEMVENWDPVPYEFGSRGPKESDELIGKLGFRYHGGTYRWLNRI